jgi:glycine dehydrogenase subunit 1
VVQNPDFLGEISSPKEMQALADAAHAVGALFVVAVEPISLGLLKPPGEYGADIVTAEGQPLGNPMGFGGPYLGVFAFRKKLVHKSSGRIVGQTADVEGRRGFVLTLTAREQHIRREKASSNICSNQALNALTAAVYMAVMGKQGLRKVAELSYHKAHELARAIGDLDGYSVVNKRPFFNEFAVKVPGGDVKELNRFLLEEYGIIGGYDLGRDFGHLRGHMLLCATEMTTADDMDALLAALDDYAGEEVAK